MHSTIAKGGNIVRLYTETPGCIEENWFLTYKEAVAEQYRLKGEGFGTMQIEITTLQAEESYIKHESM